MEWNFKIDLSDIQIFDKIEKKRGIIIPENLKKLIVKGNAATPEKYKFMVGTSERVFGAVLSFNEDEKEADTVFTALDTIDNKELLPFGIDPFGNYICLNLNTNEVVFWDHEVGATATTGKTLDKFIEELY